MSKTWTNALITKKQIYLPLKVRFFFGNTNVFFSRRYQEKGTLLLSKSEQNLQHYVLSHSLHDKMESVYLCF